MITCISPRSLFIMKGLELARELKDDYSICSMANYLACALVLGGRLPFTLGEVRALRTEADKAYKRVKKYFSKLSLETLQQQIADRVWGMDSINNRLITLQSLKI